MGVGFQPLVICTSRYITKYRAAVRSKVLRIIPKTRECQRRWRHSGHRIHQQVGCKYTVAALSRASLRTPVPRHLPVVQSMCPETAKSPWCQRPHCASLLEAKLSEACYEHASKFKSRLVASQTLYLNLLHVLPSQGSRNNWQKSTRRLGRKNEPTVELPWMLPAAALLKAWSPRQVSHCFVHCDRDKVPGLVGTTSLNPFYGDSIIAVFDHSMFDNPSVSHY